MFNRHSEQITKRLMLSMLIIIVLFLSISIPLIVNSFIEYQKAQKTLVEIHNLSVVADLANKISRERGPSNVAMSSAAADQQKNIQELVQYRQTVDAQVVSTLNSLQASGATALAGELKLKVLPSLLQGRQAVDIYLAMDAHQRNANQYDHAIQSMFSAWDHAYSLLKNVVMQSQNKQGEVSNYYTLTLILADLRDQAGRVASNIMAYVSYQQPLPSNNIAQALQTQKQVNYLWYLVNAVQLEKYKTPEFEQRYQLVKTQFIDQGIPIIIQLIEESNRKVPYHMNGVELSHAVSDKFLTVVELQKYLLTQSVEVAKQQEFQAQQKLILVSLISMISLFAALFTMVYAQKRVFSPLIHARDKILELIQRYDIDTDVEQKLMTSHSLNEAVDRLGDMLNQRAEFEFQLKNMANTDSLTGVSNRLALENYLNTIAINPSQFSQLGLIMVDIDNFKTVNDHYGHIVGDCVIELVAHTVQHSVKNADLIVRFGGDEFLVLVQGQPLVQLLALAEQIRFAIAALKISIPDTDESIHISVSLGVAVGASSWNELFMQADQSLFRAKAQGKNVVHG
ncbi:GGDEF domain-containing protein [Acinetobacter sp. Marseille-Q1618]|uniref:GGDEF domain-containing protein n=1 Tax=Acinetobacter sp. Marseille-Q1618 TaxID=2697502 RepID=UPI0015711BCB|nr:GGDEF domain-containing protein [Acinetobacter sp. Marseille-Q1618]